MVNAAAKILSKNVSQRVQKGMDLTIGKVTLPHQRHPSNLFTFFYSNFEPQICIINFTVAVIRAQSMIKYSRYVT